MPEITSLSPVRAARAVWRASRRRIKRTREQAMDRRLGISTTAPVYAEPDLAARNSRYEPLPYEALQRISARLDLSPEDVLYDLGCGKGRVVCWFARQRLKRCIGVEFGVELAETARANAASLAGQQTPIDIRTCDATLEDYADATVVTLYNPFGAEVMRQVLAKLAASLEANPRRLRIVYAAPRQLAVFREFPRFCEVAQISAPYDLGEMALIFFEAR
jgi:SAM-dependent methyltransferase